MRIEASTTTPQKLVDAIDKAIKDGDLKTWKQVKNDKKETLYSHSPAQWDETAMMKPSIEKDKVVFNVRHWSGKAFPKETDGYVLGRFTEILMVHFPQFISKLETYS